MDGGEGVRIVIDEDCNSRTRMMKVRVGEYGKEEKRMSNVEN